ncbi:hypothetical protein QFZ70_001486 [Arthrobacter sp. V1I9]|uniref:hypothetical protein n=1 Tax=Arthrobacter sp. V1I9 TaxID=3042275 RepID=UPI002790EC07|nr:hypothetical protein [Arthrobacter sp. V1I9]MDQ0869013.1 hypothetical protein [Arthrobacter sp. V1I9]
MQLPVGATPMNQEGQVKALDVFEERIQALITQQCNLARIDELKPVLFRVKDALSVSSGPRAIVRTHLVDEFIDKRIAELKSQGEQG